MINRPYIQTVLITLVIGGIGAAAAWYLGIPVPFLTGPAMVVSVVGLLGVRCKIPDMLRDACFVVIGLALGSSVTPETLSAAAAWPVSLVGMCTSVAIVMLAGGIMFQRVFGMERKTALLASSPGHLSYVIGFSADVGADTAIIAVIQSMRVLILTLAVPVAVALLTDADMSMQPLAGQRLSIVALGILVSMSAVCGVFLLKAKVPAAFLISGMIVSSIGHGTDLTLGIAPNGVSIAAFVIMGTLIGTRFSGVTRDMLKRAALGGIVLTLVGLLISISAASLVSYATDLPLIDVIIAFAPGGLETMVAMGAIVGADPAFVAIHHVARLFFLSAFVPLVLSQRKR